MIPIDEVVHFGFIAKNPTTKARSDADATPTWAVFEEDNDTPIIASQNFTKRTGQTGHYRGVVIMSAANGFIAGKWYEIVAYATVAGVSDAIQCVWHRMAPAEASPGIPKSDAQLLEGGDATNQIRDSVLSDATRFAGGDLATIKTKTNLLPASPAATGDISSPAAIASAVFEEAYGGHNTPGTYGWKLGKHLPAVLVVVVGPGSTTSAVKLGTVDGAAPSSEDTFYNGAVLVFTSGALNGQRTGIINYVGATGVATVTPLTGAPANGVSAVIV